MGLFELSPPQQERRLTEERRSQSQAVSQNQSYPNDRRSGSDRRKLICGVLYKTDGALGLLSDWLESNCTGDWKMAIEGIDEDLSQKSVRIMFSEVADKSSFLQVF